MLSFSRSSADLARLVVLAQLLLDRLDLLAEEHLALPLAQLLLHLRLDLVLGRQHADLPLDVDQHAAQPLLDAQRLQQGLLLGDRQLDVAGDEVGEPAGVGHRVEDLVQHLLGQPPPLAQLHGPLAGLAVQRGEGRVVSRRSAASRSMGKTSAVRYSSVAW